MKNAQTLHSRVRATYDPLAASYDRAIRPFERMFLARLRQKTVAALPRRATILEVGAGTGLNFSHLEPDTRGVASELSLEMIRCAAIKKRPRAVSLVQANIEALPFPDHHFEGALSTLLFCSVPSPERSFAELRRVVRPGGTIAMLEHVRPPAPLGTLFDLLNLITVPLCEDHFNRRTPEEARRAGFEVRSIERAVLGIFNIIVLRNSSQGSS